LSAKDLIELLNLEPHPSEGGFFRETFRAKERVDASAIGPAYPDARSIGTAIYFLLTDEAFSALHRVPGDEIFHFYLGDPVEMLMLLPDGSSETIVLGHDLRRGMKVQHLVPGGTWQGSRVVPGGEFALLGTTMSPGFDYADFSLADGDDLIARYPDRADEIRRLLSR
jgi:predicted cupin superfamily sugar epimerase